MTPFQRALKDVLHIEGGYSDDPADSGGETRYGITKKLAREYGYSGDMRELPKEKAIDIYHLVFWKPLKLDTVAAIDEDIALEVFEAAVNVWTVTAARWLQRSLNAFNNEGKYYADIDVDGKIGPQTLKALASFFEKRGEEGKTVLLRALNVEQGAHYLHLAANRQKDERFVYGWFLQRVRINLKS